MEGKIMKKENYFLGIIGAIIGGLILAIPLAITYMQTTWIALLILTVLIPFFEFYGYKLFRGKIDKKLSIILSTITIVIVLIMALLVFPIILLTKSNLAISMETINNIFKSSRIQFSIVQDGLISLVFAMLGVYIISCITNRKILLNVSKINLFSSDNKEKQEFKEKAVNILKPVFEKYSATEKEKTITKEEILVDVKDEKATEYFKYLKKLKIIKKYKGKYFFNLDNEKNIRIHYFLPRIICATCITVLMAAIILFITSVLIGRQTVKVSNRDVSFRINASCLPLADYSEETGWVYYKKIDTQENETEEQTSSLATIGVIYEKTTAEGISSIDDVKETLEQYINANPNFDRTCLFDIFDTKNKYEAMELIMGDDTTTEIDYYIYGEGKLAFVTGILYSNGEEEIEELRELAKEVVNSFKWNR